MGEIRPFTPILKSPSSKIQFSVWLLQDSSEIIPPQSDWTSRVTPYKAHCFNSVIMHTENFIFEDFPVYCHLPCTAAGYLPSLQGWGRGGDMLVTPFTASPPPLSSQWARASGSRGTTSPTASDLQCAAAFNWLIGTALLNVMNNNVIK